MLVERRFFKWNDAYYVDQIQLGDCINNHLDAGIITSEVDDGELKYTLTLDKNIWIGESNGFIKNIFYTKGTGDKIIGVDAFNLPYPATEHVCKHLAERFEPIPDIKSINEMKGTHKGDYLYVIFRDFMGM
ncbi:MAG: hypothetical protein ACJA1C_001954 [Crocinitomicaceae bacterium]|jgi:hypothetical protein